MFIASCRHGWCRVTELCSKALWWVLESTVMFIASSRHMCDGSNVMELCLEALWWVLQVIDMFIASYCYVCDGSNVTELCLEALWWVLEVTVMFIAIFRHICDGSKVTKLCLEALCLVLQGIVTCSGEWWWCVLEVIVVCFEVMSGSSWMSTASNRHNYCK